MNFQNQTAISTGAASGMGLLFAQNFAALVPGTGINQSQYGEYADTFGQGG